MLPFILHAQLNLDGRMLVWEAGDQDYYYFLSFLFISSLTGQDKASRHPVSSLLKSAIVHARLPSHGFWEAQRKSGI